MKDVAWTNDPQIIRQNPQCSHQFSFEVDLMGQVCADSIGDYIFSSVGGQHFYVEELCPWRQDIYRASFTHRKGTWKITAHLTPGGVVNHQIPNTTIATGIRHCLLGGIKTMRKEQRS